jgi:hypothetical protein
MDIVWFSMVVAYCLKNVVRILVEVLTCNGLGVVIVHVGQPVMEN